MSAKEIVETFQVCLLSEELKGHGGLPKDAIEAVANECSLAARSRVYVRDYADNILEHRLDVWNMRFYTGRERRFPVGGDSIMLGLCDGDIAIIDESRGYVRFSMRDSKRIMKKRYIDTRNIPFSQFSEETATRLSEDSDVFGFFSDVFLRDYMEIDMALGRVVKFEEGAQPAAEVLERYKRSHYDKFFDVGRARSLCKKQGNFDMVDPVPTRLLLIDLPSRSFREVPPPFGPDNTLYNYESYVGMADGSIMMVSGIRQREDGDTESGIICKKFDPIQETWSRLASLPTMPYGKKLCLLPNGKILAIWAYPNGRVYAYYYSPADDKWTFLSAGFSVDRMVYDVVVAD